MNYSFKNDYSETCHPRLLEALRKLEAEQVGGYGEDTYSEEARQLIRSRIGFPEAGVYFVSGGTQANLLLIAAFLRPHESVICADTGHINVHEAGAIEATGHKVHGVSSLDGKLKVQDIEEVLEEHTNVPHMVKPRLVYVSNSTEVGTVYRKEELEELSCFCRKQGLYFFLDGARLGNALVAEANRNRTETGPEDADNRTLVVGGLELFDLPRLCDAFTIGGTKNGALFGETVVVTNPEVKKGVPLPPETTGSPPRKGMDSGGPVPRTISG